MHTCPGSARARKAYLTCRPVSVASRWPVRAPSEKKRTDDSTHLCRSPRKSCQIKGTVLTCRPVTIAYRCGRRGPPGTPQARAYGSSAPTDRAPVQSAAPGMEHVSTSCLLASACLTLPLLCTCFLCVPRILLAHPLPLQQQERSTKTSALIEVSPCGWFAYLLLIVFIVYRLRRHFFLNQGIVSACVDSGEQVALGIILLTLWQHQD